MDASVESPELSTDLSDYSLVTRFSIGNKATDRYFSLEMPGTVNFWASVHKNQLVIIGQKKETLLQKSTATKIIEDTIDHKNYLFVIDFPTDFSPTSELLEKITYNTGSLIFKISLAQFQSE